MKLKRERTTSVFKGGKSDQLNKERPTTREGKERSTTYLPVYNTLLPVQSSSAMCSSDSFAESPSLSLTHIHTQHTFDRPLEILRRSLICDLFRTIKTKPIARNRVSAQDLEDVQGWFEAFRVYCEEHNIKKEDIHNFDETGFQIGVTCGEEIVVPAFIAEVSIFITI